MADKDQDIQDIKRDVKDIKRMLQLIVAAHYRAGVELISPSALTDTEKIELTNLCRRVVK